MSDTTEKRSFFEMLPFRSCSRKFFIINELDVDVSIHIEEWISYKRYFYGKELSERNFMCALYGSTGSDFSMPFQKFVLTITRSSDQWVCSRRFTMKRDRGFRVSSSLIFEPPVRGGVVIHIQGSCERIDTTANEFATRCDDLITETHLAETSYPHDNRSSLSYVADSLPVHAGDRMANIIFPMDNQGLMRELRAIGEELQQETENAPWKHELLLNRALMFIKHTKAKLSTELLEERARPEQRYKSVSVSVDLYQEAVAKAKENKALKLRLSECEQEITAMRIKLFTVQLENMQT